MVRTVVANPLSIPELERKGFRVQSDTFADWVVTSPGGTKIVFKRDTGRCDRFPFVDLNDPEVIELFGEIREENVTRLKEEVMSEHFKQG